MRRLGYRNWKRGLGGVGGVGGALTGTALTDGVRGWDRHQ